MADEITFRAKLDNSEFDRGMTELQQKLKQLQRTGSGLGSAQNQLGGDSVMGKYAKQAFGDFSKESQQNLEKMYQKQRQEAMNQRINMRQMKTEVEALEKLQNKITDHERQQLKLKQDKLELMKKEHQQTIMMAAQVKEQMDETGTDGPGGGGKGGPEQTGAGGFKNFLSGIGIASLISGALNALVTVAGDVITSERKTMVAQGASLGVAAQGLREQFAGKGAKGMFFSQERAEAMRGAAEEMESESFMGKAKAWGGTALQGVGLGTAALTGWTGIGLGAGVGMMAAGTALKGGVIGDEKSRAAMMDPEKYQAMMTKEGMGNYNARLAAIKARDPRKVMAQEYFSQNAGNMRDMQTTLGLRTDEEYLGTSDEMGPNMPGFLRSQMGMGEEFGGVSFNQENIERQAQQIIQSGGTTAGGKGLAGFSAVLQRQMGLQNAPETLGKLTGAGLGVEDSKEATKKLLAAAVKMGVDTSKMPQEMQRMTAMTAQIATAGGGFAAGGVEAAMAGIAGFDQTSIAGAATAEGMFKQAGKAASGFEGQMGFGFLQSKEAQALMGDKKLDSKDMNFLNQFSYAEAREGDFSRIAEYLDISPEDAKELLKQKDLYKQTRTSSEQKASEKLGEFLKDKGPMSPEQLETAISSGEGAKLFTRAQVEATASKGQGFSSKTQAQQRARVLQLARLNTEGLDLPEGATTPEDQVDAQLGTKEDRAGFVQEGAEATGDIAKIKALNENLDGLKNAAKAHTELAEEYNVQFTAFKDAMKAGAGEMEAISEQLEKVVEDMAEKGYLSTKPSD